MEKFGRKLKSFVIKGKEITNVSIVPKSKIGFGFFGGNWYRFTIDGEKYLQGAKNLRELKKIIKKNI